VVAEPDTDKHAEAAVADSVPAEVPESSSAPPAKPHISWVANTHTTVKRSTQLAATLAADQKFDIEPGDLIVSEYHEASGNHIKLLGVRLNGSELPDGAWFIWSPHFDIPLANASATEATSLI
jgi:hypothetical protein